MAYAPTYAGLPLGEFKNDYNNWYEYTEAKTLAFGSEFPHYVWVYNGIAHEFRYALVKKTVAYVVVDEGPNGEAITEKWFIKNHKEFPR